jgi:hypothetical protein
MPPATGKQLRGTDGDGSARPWKLSTNRLGAAIVSAAGAARLLNEERSSPMPPSPSATPPHPGRSLSVNQPEWSAGLTHAQQRANANRRPSERSRRAQARQHAVVNIWLRELVRHS